MKKLNNLFRIIQYKTYGTVAAMFFMVATCSFFACSKDDDAPVVVSPYAESRTVMVYMVAENSLNVNVATDVKEMLEGMNNDTLKAGDRLVIYLDDVSLPRIYVVDKMTSQTNWSELTPVLKYEEDVNSSSSQEMATFINYAMTHYPADSYGLVMWSHSSGWIPSNYEGDIASVHRSFGVDNGRNSSSKYLSGNQMNIADMANALQNVLKEKNEKQFDFIFFDACLMQNIEVAYELRHVTKHIIASPAEIPERGANYKTMVRAMMREKDYVTEMLSAYYDEYYRSGYGLVISAINTEKLDELATLMRTMVSAHKTELLNLDISSMLNYFLYNTWSSSFPDFLDMQGVMKSVLDETEYTQWKEMESSIITCRHAGKWYSAYPKKTISIDDAQCCGVSMFIPFEKYGSRSFNEDYLNTSWAQDVWME
jgi:hypothetical protein